MRNHSTRKGDRDEKRENRVSYFIFFLIEFIFHFMQTTLTHQAGGKSFVNCKAKIIFLQTERNKSREREEEEAFVIINADIWEAMEKNCLPYLSLSN